MRRAVRTGWMILAVAGLSLVQTAGVGADDNDGPVSVTVSFGVGLNTAQPGNAANHHVLPRTIHVRTGGVVNFAVAGLHQIFVYNPGKKLGDVIPNPNAAAFFIDDINDLYYRGILPAGGPPGTPATANPSNASNRVEPVAFLKPGRYLVICNIGVHFRDGMWAWVVVTGREQHH